ncbi:hypothetical protein V8C86DRAFT_2933980 [Haematococcus lacustris]
MKGAACLAIFLLALHCVASTTPVLIKGGTVVNHDGQAVADVLVVGERIAAVGLDLEAPEGAYVVNASGKLVMPGGIDPHTHLDMPFMGSVTCDDFFSGQAAALAGGTTMIIDHALPVDHDLMAGWEAWKRKGMEGCMDYSFHMAVTQWSDKTRQDMEALTRMGVNSFKFFMAYKGVLQVNDEELLQGLRLCKQLGALPMVHAENGDGVVYGQRHVFEEMGVTGPEGHGLSRPPGLEGEATGRAIRLAELVRVPLYVVHVMSQDAMQEVAAAKLRGARVVGEPVVSGLALHEGLLWNANFSLAAQLVMSPPIRSEVHRQALRQGLAGGVLSLVATDHCNFNSTQKAAGRHDFRRIPNGVHGLEERLHVVWDEMVNSGLMAPSDFVRVVSTTAAQVFNLYPRKGRLAVGSDADIIVFDPLQEHTLSAASHHHRNDLNIYEGRRVRGRVVTTLSRGRVVWEHGQLRVERNTGRLLALPLFGPLFEGLDAQDDGARSHPYGPTPVQRPLHESCTKEEL